METIHNKLKRNSRAYAKWHEHPHHKKVHWGVVIVVSVVLVLFMLKMIGSWQKINSNIVLVGISKQTAILTLEPKTKSVKIGDSFTVDVMLDTDSKPVDGVDLYSLHYDPTILNVVDALPNKDGIQIIPGTIMDVNAANIVDQSKGTIKFSQAASGGVFFTGRGVLASIHFKAVGKGTTYLKFDFDLGSTKDTNVAHKGRDQLVNVVDALFTVDDK